MTIYRSRRDFLKLSGLAGVVFSSGLFGRELFAGQGAKAEEFYFVQFTDTHFGFNKKKVNPDPVAGLNRAIDRVNALKDKPDFIMFTGDLTHTVDDPAVRRQRLRDFRKIIDRLEVQNIRFIPGEHDASLDNGAAYKEIYGDTHYHFSHKGINFVALDNVSNPRGIIGDAQLSWLKQVLAGMAPDQPLVVFAHRPLFALYPKWGWTTGDGDRVLEMLTGFKHVTVFYGHIHQEHHHVTGHIKHHSAKSLIFPLPAPGSSDKRKPLPWDSTHPYRGLGVREVEAYGSKVEFEELDLT